jgi:hypothetical protein
MFNKTKFPGKPSKLVNKKRVSVLSFDNNFDKRANASCEIDTEKNLASHKHEHGYQVYNRGRSFLHFCNFNRNSLCDMISFPLIYHLPLLCAQQK